MKNQSSVELSLKFDVERTFKTFVVSLDHSFLVEDRDETIKID